ncbi:MAG: nuclear transport factor 2 family protein [Deltaproteobacteria bacterium]|nr:nuclear transport factor 2 family protein [Deltaproteobacteria bacterium]
MSDEAVKQEIWSTIRALNDAWTVHDDAEKLREYFHRDMVAITPTDRLRREGREACVAGWKGFIEQAKVTRWRELEPKIHVYGEGRFAVVTYYYEMACQMGGRAFDLSGRDMLTLVLEDGRWWVVADQFSSYPA